MRVLFLLRYKKYESGKSCEDRIFLLRFIYYLIARNLFLRKVGKVIFLEIKTILYTTSSFDIRSDGS